MDILATLPIQDTQVFQVIVEFLVIHLIQDTQVFLDIVGILLTQDFRE